MLVVRHAGVDPLAEPVAFQPPGPKLIAQVTVDVVHDLEQHKQAEQAHMYWKQKGSQRNDARFQDRLDRVKCIGCPWRWIGGAVVDQMNKPE